ncbi:hypothetical protein DSM104299_05544 [Baekduia alba]|nr:hypothetical protein [Baekduia alba]WCB96776.1 hypothetical protein DSM104299_05544 [Baekduia alba]
MASTALFYNFGFFTVLAFEPFPLQLGVHEGEGGAGLRAGTEAAAWEAAASRVP